MRKKPDKESIKKWLKDETTKWFLEKLAWYLNTIDTVRDINSENIDEALARKMAIDIIEGALADVWEAGELEKLQRKIASEEDNILKRLREITFEY